MTVGALGYGTLVVADNAEVYVGTDLTTGNPAGAPIGTLNLDGGSIYVGDDFLNSGVFNFTDGLLRVAGDFQPSAGAGPFTIDGDNYADLPALDLIGSGANSNVTILTVGGRLRGQLSLRQGRLLNLVVSDVNVGARAGSEGMIDIEAGAELRTTGTLAVAGSGGVAGGEGNLNIDGGTVNVGSLQLHPAGALNLIRGTLIVKSMPILEGKFNWVGGRLQFDFNTTLTDTTATQFLSVDKTLRGGQTLASPATLTLATLTEANLGGAKLTNAFLDAAMLSNTNLVGADLRGATTSYGYADLTGSMASNTIRPDGTVRALDLTGGDELAVRDDDGVPDPPPFTWAYRSFDPLVPRPPIPITVQDHFAMSGGGVLRLVFEADAWDSLISFEPGIPVELGGTLELAFADEVAVAGQVGRTLRVFDWTGVTPTGAFAVASPYQWDVSQLYTTGQVTLLAVPEPSALVLFLCGLCALYALARFPRRIRVKATAF